MKAPTSSLSARSIIASTLLGTHPPAMRGRLLVALAARFGIAEGTVRVAMSRMVEAGELTNHDGRYELEGHLLRRQLRQDSARRDRPGPWDGSWEQAVMVGGAVSAARRQERRTSLAALKLAELREGVWLRPANLDRVRLPEEPARIGDDIMWALTQPETEPSALAAELWDLSGWAKQARELTDALKTTSRGLDADDDEVLAPGFVLSATVLRHFVADPDLPNELMADDWPANDLRTAYTEFDHAYRRLLGRFFAEHEEQTPRSA